jgi:dTDP-4-amino-4,6-dideoxygalactose transaminase
MYYLVLPDERTRNYLIDELNDSDINAVFHYIPLHSSPAGRRYGRAQGTLDVTDAMSQRLVRLPLWNDMTPALVERVVGVVSHTLSGSRVQRVKDGPAASTRTWVTSG